MILLVPVSDEVCNGDAPCAMAKETIGASKLGKISHSDNKDVLAKEELVPQGKTKKQLAKERRKALGLAYAVDENPPWYICLILGFQHYMTMVGGTLSQPFILSVPMCFSNNPLAIAEVLCTMFFVSGIATIIQATFGVRLPIVQGGTFSFLAPIFAILSLPKWQCHPVAMPTNSTLSNGTLEFGEVDWKSRMREIQGAIMVSSLFQIVIGFSGVLGVLLKFIGPITIAPTIALIGLSLFHVAAEHAGSHWGISIMTIALITLFSQFLSNTKIPFPSYSPTAGFRLGKYPVFRLFPIILAIAVSWIICAIITVAGGFPDDPSNPGYKARTDARTIVLSQAEWFRFPLPAQWGTPTVSAAGVFGMLAGVLASIIESVGDYYACARLSGAPPPPKHAINRGIGVEGIGCLITGLWGSGNGTTSYSENIGAIGITKVGSLRVIQYGGLVMMLVGVVGKVGALFTTVPDPIVGGLFVVMFGMIACVGISNLQFVDLNSSRNLFVVGFSLLLGMALPYYLNNHPGAIDTGVNELDQIITVLLKTSMAVGGLTALLLDNIIPGTPEERGLLVWRAVQDTETEAKDAEKALELASIHIYDLPFCLKYLSKYTFAKYIPFLPYYSPKEEHRNSLPLGRLNGGSGEDDL
ncbi:solute carrier family 23 member 1 isoform X2 [Nematostella vectensis]|uniref:solute carrier family 23 member 1 isoform X2 n=1 Tax=Nematostella vectensis TaxID=45351 RepID=UPI002076DEDF|nr:solute carrier family 23 member 1 isoform X2 [Nematostella vectensis]